MIDRRCSRRDRRQHPRTAFIAAVAVTFRDLERRAPQAVELAQAQNLSRGGIELLCARELHHLRGARVWLAFELPESDTLVRLGGQVIFDRPSGACWSTGVRFDSAATAELARIGRYLEMCEELSFAALAG